MDSQWKRFTTEQFTGEEGRGRKIGEEMVKVVVRFTEKYDSNTGSASSNGGSIMEFKKDKKIITKIYFQKVELGVV